MSSENFLTLLILRQLGKFDIRSVVVICKTSKLVNKGI